MDNHNAPFHAGVNSTVTAIRQEYWITAARQCIITRVYCIAAPHASDTKKIHT